MNFDFFIGYGPSFTGDRSRKTLTYSGLGNREETTMLAEDSRWRTMSDSC